MILRPSRATSRHTLANLWHFMAGRGAHEKTIAQLKSGLAFQPPANPAYAFANSAWQLGRPRMNPADELPDQASPWTVADRANTPHFEVLCDQQTKLRSRPLHRAALPLSPGGKVDLAPGEQSRDTELVHAHRPGAGPSGLIFCRIRLTIGSLPMLVASIQEFAWIKTVAPPCTSLLLSPKRTGAVPLRRKISSSAPGAFRDAADKQLLFARKERGPFSRRPAPRSASTSSAACSRCPPGAAAARGRPAGGPCTGSGAAGAGCSLAARASCCRR